MLESSSSRKSLISQINDANQRYLSRFIIIIIITSLLLKLCIGKDDENNCKDNRFINCISSFMHFIFLIFFSIQTYFTDSFRKHVSRAGLILAIYLRCPVSCHYFSFYFFFFFANDILEYDSSYPAFYRLSASRDDPRK